MARKTVEDYKVGIEAIFELVLKDLESDNRFDFTLSCKLLEILDRSHFRKAYTYCLENLPETMSRIMTKDQAKKVVQNILKDLKT